MTDAHQIRTVPDPYAPFRIAQGYRVGDLIFLSGQAALSETGAVVGPGDFDTQAEQTFANIKVLLEAAHSSLSQVVKVTIYLTDMAYFPRIVDLRGRYFQPPWPADTIVEVRALALPDLMIEIDVIALASGRLVAATP